MIASAEPAAEFGRRSGRGLTIEELADAGGGTEIFRTAVSFAGFFVLVVITGLVAIEFSRGTMRTMLLNQPRRLPLLAGKLAALLTCAAATLGLTEAVSWITSRLLAPGSDIDTHAWTSIDALGAAVTDFGAVLLWITGYALIGTALAVVLRSVTVALAVGIAWFGPLEHITQEGWATANRIFPGLLLEAFAAGGTTEVTVSRALLTVLAYSAVAATVAAAVFVRRDITA